MLRSPLRLAIAMLAAAFLLPWLTLAQAQEQPPQSVAEAAQRAKEAKKKASGKSKVVTDEDIEAKKTKSVQETPVPQAAAPQPAGEPIAKPSADAGVHADADVQKKNDAAVARLKQQLASEEEALDLDKRDAALAQDTYYSNPEHDRDKAGKARLDALQQQISERQQKVQDLKARLAALEAARPAASAPASTSPPSTF